MWILILTLIGPFQKDGSAIEMHEFSTRETCMTAGREWLKHIGSNGYQARRATCVKK